MKLEGMDQLVKNLSSFGEKVVESVTRATQISQALVVNDAKENHPYKDRTGNLTNSIQPGRVLIDDKSVEAEIIAGMEYASFVEFGTSRTRPYPFLVPAVYAQQADFVKRVADAVGGTQP